MNGCMNKWVDGHMAGWMHEWMTRRTHPVARVCLNSLSDSDGSLL